MLGPTLSAPLSWLVSLDIRCYTWGPTQDRLCLPEQSATKVSAFWNTDRAWDLAKLEELGAKDGDRVGSVGGDT